MARRGTGTDLMIKEWTLSAFQASPFFATFLDSLPAAAYTCDSKGLITSYNALAVQVWGRAPRLRDPADRYCGSFKLFDLSGKPLAREQSWMARALRENRRYYAEEAIIERTDGSRRHVLAHASPFHTANGRICGAMNVLVDITREKAAQCELDTARAAAQQASDAKSQFLANMSHEIRTPMNGILGMATVLETTEMDERQTLMVRTIRDSGRGLLEVLNSALDLSKIEAGRIDVEAMLFSPRQTAETVHQLHLLNAEEKGLDLALVIGEGCGDRRVGDATRFGRILHNLVSNALKFTEKGRVLIELGGSGAELVCKVSDTGCGMTPDECEHAFEPFAQATGPLVREHGGCGLGLAIVKGLVEVFHGAVEVTSTPGSGTAFTVRLPFPLAEPMHAREKAEHRTTKAGDAVTSGEPLRVLAVEDNPTNRSVLQLLLEPRKIDLVLAENGRTAVDLFEPDAFDVVLMDIHMPEMDGETALRHIQEKAGATPPPPVYALTADVMTYRVKQYADLGFSGCIAKPFQLEELLDVLRGAANRRPQQVRSMAG